MVCKVYQFRYNLHQASCISQTITCDQVKMSLTLRINPIFYQKWVITLSQNMIEHHAMNVK